MGRPQPWDAAARLRGVAWRWPGPTLITCAPPARPAYETARCVVRPWAVARWVRSARWG